MVAVAMATGDLKIFGAKMEKILRKVGMGRGSGGGKVGAGQKRARAESAHPCVPESGQSRKVS